MKKIKLIKILAGFFALMLLFTFLSRAADSVNVAQVETKTAQNQVITHEVTGTGKVMGTRERAVFTQEGQKVEQVYVQEGQNVKKGDALLKFSVKYLKKTIKEKQDASFSVLFAAYKGDLSYYIEGAKAIDSLKETSHVLIAECCTHAPLKEDIGRVKIPRMLKKRFGENLQVELVSGTDFPDDFTGYDLIIQCGACMFNRKYVMYRIDSAKKQQVPVTNYGITIAHLTGILDHVALPE